MGSLKADKIAFDELTPKELSEVLNYALTNKDFDIQKKLGNHFTKIYDYATDKPYWLKSSYSSTKTIINFGTNKNDTLIDWSVIKLNDGLLLTSPKHAPLLNAFKNWLLAVSNPIENGGILTKGETAKNKINTVITLIDAILINSDALDLARYHLSNITEDFWFSIFIDITVHRGGAGVYKFESCTESLLKERIKDVSDEKALWFLQKYPYIGRDIPSDEKGFSFNKIQRAKACYWLYSVGFYRTRRSFTPKGNGAVLEKFIFKGKVISPSVKFPKFPELWLEDEVAYSEYKTVENYETGESSSEGSIIIYLNALKLINTNIKKENASSPCAKATQNISIKKLQTLTPIRPSSRTRTQHPDQIFKLTKQSFEFILKYQEDILNATLATLAQGIKKSIYKKINPNCPDKSSNDYISELHDNISRYERLSFMQTEALKIVDKKAISNLGITQVLPYNLRDNKKFELIRNRNSLFELHRVLIGALQFILGLISARRQGELISLKSRGNLSPDKNPLDEANENLEYNLVFKLKKSGNGGKISVNKTIERPISSAVAKLIWRLEQFNKQAESFGLFKGKTALLFNSIDAASCTLFKNTADFYNRRLDNLCDYFETNLVLYDNGQLRRNYVRQHQLRRFFALLFFWQKRFQGLESLRWMLGHSDMSHLWNYISGVEMGDVLHGVKASVIVNTVLNKDKELTKIKTIEELRKVLAKRFNTDSSGNTVFIDSLDGAIDSFDDDDISIPHISKLRAESQLETNLEILLKNGEISLEPNFFSIVDTSGKQRETFNLAFQVKF